MLQETRNDSLIEIILVRVGGLFLRSAAAASLAPAILIFLFLLLVPLIGIQETGFGKRFPMLSPLSYVPAGQYDEEDALALVAKAGLVLTVIIALIETLLRKKFHITLRRKLKVMFLFLAAGHVLAWLLIGLQTGDLLEIAAILAVFFILASVSILLHAAFNALADHLDRTAIPISD